MKGCNGVMRGGWSRWWGPAALLWFGWVELGCGAGARVRTSEALPLTRVVVYRNGVAYFERAGRFDGDELEFRVRRFDVSDFLSSLTAVDRSGKVRSVSFEIEEEQAPGAEQPPFEIHPEVAARGVLWVPPETPAKDQDSDSDEEVTVRMRLEGERHDMTVAYVIAAPLWRPTYRAVVDEQGLLLQVWAVVHNNSGEDWRDVRLSLTAGAPIAFESDLGTPVTPRRPRVTDRGEVVAVVPGSETTLAQVPAARARRRAMAQRGPAPAQAAMSDVGEEDAEDVGGLDLASSTVAQAEVAEVEGGLTRYDLDGRVTVSDGGSTMVTLFSRRVGGEVAHLFAPKAGVADSTKHPFRVARLLNGTGAMLERGPIAVLGGGDFLGQGVLEPLAKDATAFVPFALDRTLAIRPSHAQQESEGRLVRIAQGRVEVERFRQFKTTYTLRSGAEGESRVYIKHVRRLGTDLIQPRQGVELTAESALVPVTLPAHSERVLEVEERTPVRRSFSFLSDAGAAAVALYLQGPAVAAAQGPLLRQALGLRGKLEGLRRRLRSLEQERLEVRRRAQQTRENLRAIEKAKSASKLRRALLDKLAKLERSDERLTTTVVEQKSREAELRLRLSELVQRIALEPEPALVPR